jgi:TM2 domain-containing membrane protein YozV
MAAGLCAILLGGLGVHKFILGYQSAGWVYLGVLIGGILLTCISFGLIPIIALTAPVMGIISLIEGVIYLTKTDEEFYHIYMFNRREWF